MDLGITRRCYPQPDRLHHGEQEVEIQRDQLQSIPGADIGSDHQLLIANFRLKLKTECIVNERKLDVKKLKDPAVATAYRTELSDRATGVLGLDEEVGQMWTRVEAAFNSPAKLVLGHPRNGRQNDWISSETYKPVDEKRELKAHKQDGTLSAKHYNFLCREIRRRCKQDRETYINSICKEVETAHMQKKS